ncbi:MAG TPA: SGNH/GDSL hydrolase family protein [Burkholderiales bacterium]|nr:SGNH/GDSL hydrolase family protein [Burkholderiales bacterium]
MLVRAFARFLFAILGYLCLATLVFVTSFALLRMGIPTGLPWLQEVQANLYHGGLRNIWQNQPDCVTFDEKLIYRPRDGECAFHNAEFHTVLHFAGGIRAQKPIARDRAGIAVIGDSYAMGWGVNDDETFAAVLQERLGRPVYNLGVSSYGTTRELMALEMSGLLDKVDTVIIQYCDNDLEENLHFNPASAQQVRDKFAQVTRRTPSSLTEQLPFLFAGLRYALKVPFGAIKALWKAEPTLNFSPHYHALVAAIGKYEALREKTVVVFYINDQGKRFTNFPNGADRNLTYVRFADLNVGREKRYALDGHLTVQGNRYVAERLVDTLASR